MPATSSPGGLTSDEVAQRVSLGQTNRVDGSTSRSIGVIVRSNVVTRFNLLLGSMAALILAVGSARDALFGLILIANTAVGIIQEVRAKQTLDKLALLDTSTARVLRDGIEIELDVGDVVLDDVILVARGDQIIADGTVIEAAGLEVDEALLTGESDPVAPAVGGGVRSGSVVIAGSGRYRADKVGAAAYANVLAAEARQYRAPTSEISGGIDSILRIVTWALVPTAALLIFSQVKASASLPAAVAGSVAGVVSMVPEGLVLLTSMAMAVSVIRLGKQSVLTRELQAIEGLARVDTLCVDKTGTLTEGLIQLDRIEPVGGAGEAEIRKVLGALGASDPNPNPSLAAIIAACPSPDWDPSKTIPFSSDRKWSGAVFDRRTWLLGAPDVLAPDADLLPSLVAHRDAGRRVLVLASTTESVDRAEALPLLDVVALVVLSERIKTDAASTLAYFADQKVRVKVISGDHPATVAAVARAVGLDAGNTIDATDYLDDPDRLVDLVDQHCVVGRVSPEQKQIIVNGLQARGRTVAMTGDGVNDLLALKDATVGIAMGSGSSAARSVAQFVLLDNQFSGLPGVVAEGRRVIGNIERVGKLFLTKTVYALLLSLAIGVAQLPFPLLPRHLSLIAAVNIGIPAFFLALAPNTELARPGFVSRVLRFAVPAGVIAAIATFMAYADIMSDGATLPQSQTTAAIMLFILGTVTLVIAARPLTQGRVTVVAAMTALFGLALAIPSGRSFYALDIPPLFSWLTTALTAGIAAVALIAALDRLGSVHLNRLLRSTVPANESIDQG